MTLLIILFVLSVPLTAAVVVSALRHDPPREIPRSHPRDRRFEPPMAA